MTRLGLFGGTFDPVHYGHLRTVEAARLELNLDRVQLLPNPSPPHKLDLPLTPYKHRLRMLELALREFPRLEIARVEELAGGPAYTTDTLRRVIRNLPAGDHELWLIIGADSLIDLPLWKNPEDLFRDAKVAVLPRPGVDLDRARPEYRARARELKTPLVDISASEIRHRLAQNTPLETLLPAAVLDYIRAHGLYGAKQK